MGRDGLFMYVHISNMLASFDRARYSHIMERRVSGRWSGTRVLSRKVCSFRQGWIEAEHAAGSGLVRRDPRIRISRINWVEKWINARARPRDLIHFY